MIADRREKSRVWRHARALLAIGFSASVLVPARAQEKLAAPAASAPEKPASVFDPNEPQFAGHFRGTVIGPDGEAVKGARVFLVPFENDLDEAVRETGPVRAETDAEGRFEFDAPDATYTDLDSLPARSAGLVIATADGYGADWLFFRRRRETAFEPAEDRIRRNEFELQLAKDDVPIHGRFLDPYGRPLANARVEVTYLAVPRQRNLDAHLEREIKKSVYSDFLSGSSNARDLHRPDLISGLTADTRTDADGRFTVTGIGRDRLATVKVSAPSVVETSITVMTREVLDVQVRLGGDAKLREQLPPEMIYGAGFELKLTPGRTITGVVRDAETGKPIVGMWVGRGSEHPRDGVYWDQTVTDAEGRFAITGLDPTVEKWNLTAASSPRMMYQAGGVEVKGESTVEIVCERGIPFRLKVVDEQGRPVEAEVFYDDVLPNPHAPTGANIPNRRHVSKAVPTADGMYEGFVLPGPGAVLVTTPGRPDFRAAYVDPKAFFEPERTDWSGEEEKWKYGDTDAVQTSFGGIEQTSYAAIVLVNPAPNSPALELVATVGTDRPRQVHLVDADGNPVEDVTAEGMTSAHYEAPLRAGSFFLTKLRPERVKRILFTKEKQNLVGLLQARGDGVAPYTVRMMPWGTATGQLVDVNGDARPPGKIIDETGRELPTWWPENGLENPPKLVMNTNFDDPRLGDSRWCDVDKDGKFHFERLIPGERYGLRMVRGNGPEMDVLAEDVVIGPQAALEIGVRAKVSFAPTYERPTAESRQVPDDAWGDAVDGLRAALVPRSPAMDENQRLHYDIVVENASDHEIRFAAAIHHSDGFYKLGFLDVDGEEPQRQPGTLDRYNSPPHLVRFLLKPGEQAVIGPGTSEMVRLDEAGKAISSPERNYVQHAHMVKPGRYFVSAAVELGPTIECLDSVGKRTAISPLEGEWSGKLQTGLVVVGLFNDAAAPVMKGVDCDAKDYRRPMHNSSSARVAIPSPDEFSASN